MTPKEKAIELRQEFVFRINEYIEPKTWDEVESLNTLIYKAAKDCAELAVEELINEVYNISHQYTAVYDEETKSYNYTDSKELKFWKEVIKEIEAL
jgi:hypothetical protein